MASPRYLTKSRFKLATECEAKLFYTRKKEYADQSAENPFLIELAKGGYQVGELAKYYFYNDRPVPSVDSLDYNEALDRTNELVESGEQFIAEAAVCYGDLFIRADVFEIDTEKKTIHFYEVKAKSWDSEDIFIKEVQRGEDRGKLKIDNNWKSYLFDAAFQKYVISKAYPGYKVFAYLMLINKDAVATVDGLNQFFKIKGDTKNYSVYADPSLSREMLGEAVLRKINVDEEVEFIWSSPVDSLALPGLGFEQYIQKLSGEYKKDIKIETPISKECKACQFYAKPTQENDGKKSGRTECWMHELKITKEESVRPKVIELWGGKYGAESIVQKLMNEDKYFLQDIEEGELPGKDKDTEGLSPKERRWKQIEFVRNNSTDFFFDKDGFKAEMEQWRYPLHFIDFETASPALPFTKNAHPYEGIAFQFSHHIMDSKGKIEHKTQFLKADRGTNPNVNFVRALHRALSGDNGTIFRYHNHENTYLRMLRNQINGMADNKVSDKQILLDFIDTITKYKVEKEEIHGPRCMEDMYELVLKYYYSPHTHGSNSLKFVLPAAIHDSTFLKEKYSRPVCGIGKEVSSLNFDDKIWIDPKFNNDPYKTLPKVFEGYDRDTLDDLFSGMDELADGGAAMMAYAKLQYFDTPADQREAIETALYKYCELDTLAMVMLMEFWRDELKK